MKANDIVKTVMTEAGLSQKQLATKMGLRTQQGMRNLLLAQHGMRIDNFIKMMNLLGYDVMVKNRVNDKMIEVEAGSCATDTHE